MVDAHLRALRAATEKQHRAIADEIARQSKFSLIDLINARMRHPARQSNSKLLDATLAIDAACRTASGQAANGAWVPLHVLTRDLTAAGSALTTGRVGTNLEDTLRPASAIVGAGATVIAGVKAGDLMLPAVGTPLNASGSWIGEGAAYPQSEPSFRQIAIQARTLAVEILVSRQLLRNSSVSLENELRGEIFRQFMGALDAACLTGTSAANQPDGLLTLASIPLIVGGANGAAPTWEHLVNLEHSVAAANGRIERGSYLTNAAVIRKLRLTPRGSGLDYILSDGDRIFGYPARVSQLVPSNLTKGTATNCSAIVFGDFSEAILAFWGPAAIDLIVDDVTRAKDGLVRLVARAEVGFAPRNPGAFAVMRDVLTT